MRPALLALLLTGCATHPIPSALPPPPAADCAPICRVECTADGIAYEPGSDPLGDLVQQVVLPLRQRLTQCELSRSACVQCLDRLQQAGVIR